MYLNLYLFELHFAWSGSLVPQFKFKYDDDNVSKVLRIFWWDFTYNSIKRSGIEIIGFILFIMALYCLLHCSAIGLHTVLYGADCSHMKH